MSFKEWTVLRHGPIEKLANNVWSVEGWMPKGNQRRMTVARLDDGRLIVHNAVALGPSEMSELDNFGEVAAIIVPNAFHRQDAFIWKARYAKAKVYAPKKAMAKVSKVVPLDGDYDAVPHDAHVRCVHLEGAAGAEGLLEVRSDDGRTLVFNDALLNLEPQPFVKNVFLGPSGRPSVPRFARWLLLKDKKAFANQLRSVATGAPLQRVIVGHGATLVNEPSKVLSALADELG